MVASIVLIVVLCMIALRSLSPFALPIWAITAGGALVVLLTKQISLVQAFHAIDFEVIGYLIGVFIIGQAMETSGYLEQLSSQLFQRAKRPHQLLLMIIVFAGLSSMFLMNDTIAIIATPIVLYLAQQCDLPHQPLLLALAYSVTIGSIASPIGNPQNLMIAVNANLPHPFHTFFGHLFLPTMLCLLIAYAVIWLGYRKALGDTPITITAKRPHDAKLTLLCKISLTLMLVCIALKMLSSYQLGIPNLPFSVIALLSALPILVFSHKRQEVLTQMDWHTIVFFIALFILVQSVWDADWLRPLLEQHVSQLTSTGAILMVSVLASQLISNVPLVALYLPILLSHGANTSALMALAAGSTLAGNFLVMGAASNVIVIQNAEKRRASVPSFLRFALTGAPLGLINLLVYWLVNP